MAGLPITRVVLFKHGVGYFERSGNVEGETTLNFTFKQAEVSDVLKSLTVLDLGGGHISSVSYDSTKPLEQLLAEVALSIPDRKQSGRPPAADQGGSRRVSHRQWAEHEHRARRGRRRVHRRPFTWRRHHRETESRGEDPRLLRIVAHG